MVTASPRRRSQLGQSLVEVAIATPVLIALLLGAFDAAVLISDKVIAGAACRQGARLASELGGTLTNTSIPAMTWPEADAYIFRNVLAVAKAMNYSNIKQIYVYSPTEADGNLTIDASGNPTGPDKVDWWNVSGPASAYTVGPTQYSNLGLNLDQRIQIPPGETPLGVKIRWTYVPPTGLAINVVLTEYAVFLAAPFLA